MFTELINLPWLKVFSCGNRFPQYRAGEGRLRSAGCCQSCTVLCPASLHPHSPFLLTLTGKPQSLRDKSTDAWITMEKEKGMTRGNGRRGEETERPQRG